MERELRTVIAELNVMESLTQDARTAEMTGRAKARIVRRPGRWRKKMGIGYKKIEPWCKGELHDKMWFGDAA